MQETPTHTSFEAVRIHGVALWRGAVDDLCEVDGGPGKGHTVPAQPVAERLRLAPQLVQLVLVLGEYYGKDLF